MSLNMIKKINKKKNPTDWPNFSIVGLEGNITFFGLIEYIPETKAQLHYLGKLS